MLLGAPFNLHAVGCKQRQLNIKSNYEHPFTIKAQMCWSKNVSEERDAPDQILFGSMNEDNCVLLALSIHLETWIGTGDAINQDFLFGIYGTPEATKNSIFKRRCI